MRDIGSSTLTLVNTSNGKIENISLNMLKIIFKPKEENELTIVTITNVINSCGESVPILPVIITSPSESNILVTLVPTPTLSETSIQGVYRVISISVPGVYNLTVNTNYANYTILNTSKMERIDKYRNRAFVFPPPERYNLHIQYTPASDTQPQTVTISGGII